MAEFNFNLLKALKLMTIFFDTIKNTKNLSSLTSGKVVP